MAALACPQRCAPDRGIDGLLLTWVDYVDGIGHFTRDVLPLMEAAGLRAPFRPDTASDRAGNV